MSKKDSEKFEWVRIVVSDDGVASARYKLEGNANVGSHRHDEDVSEWEDAEIIKVMADAIEVPVEERAIIELDRE